MADHRRPQFVMLDALKASVATLKGELDALRPLSDRALAQLRKYHDVELTFTSNAIEGNSLTHRETAEVIEHGITVGGKPIRDHLEALDHYDAVLWMRSVAGERASVHGDGQPLRYSAGWPGGERAGAAKRARGAFPNRL